MRHSEAALTKQKVETAAFGSGTEAVERRVCLDAGARVGVAR